MAAMAEMASVSPCIEREQTETREEKIEGVPPLIDDGASYLSLELLTNRKLRTRLLAGY